ncbi:hypothetical protein [Portibacter lacus]|uniref:Uncharacterized protein n=1 Tax=Portibacter lacus TaxID=1099794 RepID=A0AA37SRH2_9BACT|nr:hypothetical protein [Portibacter lacus]GLR19531.1 hypothetical protein GCM10007940_41470 [Portibacter lacus]
MALIISTGVYCDRNGEKYEKCVQPDEEVAFIIEKKVEKDADITQAINWLKKK